MGSAKKKARKQKREKGSRRGKKEKRSWVWRWVGLLLVLAKLTGG